MNRRIETRVIDTVHVAMGVLIERDASEVYWITVNPQTLGTMCLLQIYDGFDAAGKLEYQITPGYTRVENFVPPIHCDYGIFVYTDAHVESYTIAWRPKKWNRPAIMKADEIRLPEAKG